MSPKVSQKDPRTLEIDATKTRLDLAVFVINLTKIKSQFTTAESDLNTTNTKCNTIMH